MIGLKALNQLFRISGKRMTGVLIASIFINLLYLVGPFYMMHVYDSVVGVNSHVNLYAISAIALFLYLMFWGFDAVRSKLIISLVPHTEQMFERYAKTALSGENLDGQRTTDYVRSLEKVQQFLLSPALAALFDLPFAPLFIFVAFVIHPILGMIGIGATLFMLVVYGIFNVINGRHLRQAGEHRQQEAYFGKAVLSLHETVKVMGASRFATDRWGLARQHVQAEQLHASGANSTVSSMTKTFRMMLQSVALGVGAWLVLRNEMSPGGIIAGSIVLGRAIGPIQQAVMSWRTTRTAMEALNELSGMSRQASKLLQQRAGQSEKEQLVDTAIEIQNITFRYGEAPNPIFRGISFKVPSGALCAVTGPNGSGKTTLVRCLVGLLKPESGLITVGEVEAGPAFSSGKYAHALGYLPQRNDIFPMTIAENISLQENCDQEEVKRAAQRAGCHGMIMSLPGDYNKPLTGEELKVLSPGLIQKISIARAIYGNPGLIVFDEPYVFLDDEGIGQFGALLGELRNNGTTVVIVSNNPQLTQMTDYIFMFHPIAGTLFGPTRELLNKLAGVEKPPQPVGVS